MSDAEAAIRWYAVLALAGAAGWPLCLALFREHRRHAHWFARPVGMLSVLFPTWFLASTVNFPFTTIGLWITLIGVSAAGWWWVWRRRLVAEVSVRNLVVAEAVTLLVFLGALWLRGFTPDILNTEKPMDSAFLSATMTLEPGDVIFTGTPGTTSAMKPGDTVEVEIDGIGVLRNPVKAG